MKRDVLYFKKRFEEADALFKEALKTIPSESERKELDDKYFGPLLEEHKEEHKKEEY